MSQPNFRQQAGIVLAAIAIVAMLVCFVAWLFDLPTVQGFGVAERPIWPISILGFLAVAASFIAGIRGRRGRSIAFAFIPALLGAITILGALFGTDLFEPIRLVAIGDPSRGPLQPTAGAALIFLTLAFATVQTAIGGRVSRNRAAMAAWIAFMLGTIAFVLGMIATSPNIEVPRFNSTLPAAVAAMLLSAAIALWNDDLRWTRVLRGELPRWGMLRVLLPMALVMPVIPSLIEHAVVDNGLLLPIEGEILVVILNILIVGVLIYIAASYLSRENAHLIEFSDALDSATVAFVDDDGTIIHWSQGCEELYGWSAQEALGEKKYMLLRSRCEQSWRPGLPARSPGDTQDLIEYSRVGREIAVHERSRRVASGSRAPITVLTMTDVTRSVESVQALRATEERLALAAAAHELGIVEWDVESGVLNWSPGTERRLGFPTGSLNDFERWRAVVEPEDVQETLDTITRAVSVKADRFSFRYRLRHPSIGLRTIEGSARAFYGRDGTLLRTTSVVLDITERDAHENALRAREAHLRSVLDTVPDAMVVTDEAGVIRQFSVAAEAMWGMEPGAAVGRNIAVLAAPEDRDLYVGAVAEFQEVGLHPFVGMTVASTGRTADGRSFPMEIRTGMARTDGSVLFTMFFRDLTEQITSEERMRELNAQLAHVSRQSAMSELAADLAHELNQPLSATSNFLAAAQMLMQRGEDSNRIAELIKMGADQTLRAGEIIRKLRAFMARGEVEMRVEDIESTVRDAVDLVVAGTGRANTRVSMYFSPDAHVMVADRIQVQQVLVNLLRNALEVLRATNVETPQITIETRRQGEEMVEFEVSDNGPGIPEPVLNQLYTRFVTTKEASGMGIGLSISRRIIEAHGGAITAENRPDGGAVFRFTVPMIEQEGME